LLFNLRNGRNSIVGNFGKTVAGEYQRSNYSFVFHPDNTFYKAARCLVLPWFASLGGGTREWIATSVSRFEGGRRRHYMKVFRELHPVAFDLERFAGQPVAIVTTQFQFLLSMSLFFCSSHVLRGEDRVWPGCGAGLSG